VVAKTTDNKTFDVVKLSAHCINFGDITKKWSL